MNRRTTVVIGAALVIFGIYLLLSEYGYGFRLHVSWPLILLVVGAALIASFFTAKPKTGNLFLGALVFWLGIFFLLMENQLEYSIGYGRMWPGFVIALALAHLTTGFLKPSARRHISTGVLLLGVGAICFFISFHGFRNLGFLNLMSVVGIVVIIFGLKLIFDFFLGAREKT